MILPDALAALLHQRDFWRRFFWDLEDDHEYPELEECQIALPLVDGGELVLGLDEGLSYFSLGLRHPSLPDDVEIAWDDQSHWHPHVLQWEELDLIGRWVALHEPKLPHPGVVVALLHRFTPLTRSDDPAVVHPILEAAYRSLGVYRGKALEERFQQYDFRDAGFFWRQDACGWVPDQDMDAPDAGQFSLYTRREAGYPEFPFELWNRLLAGLREQYRAAVEPAWLAHGEGRAGALARSIAESGMFSRGPELAEALEQAGCRNAAILNGLRADAPVTICWVLELLLEEELGAYIRKHCAKKKRPRRVLHRFEISYPGFPVRPRLMPDHPRIAMTTELDAQLRQRVAGRAEAIGCDSTYSEDGRTLLEETTIIACRAADDPEEATRIIREVLRKHGAPEGTRLRQTAREEREIPLVDPEALPPPAG